ncbi:hypothetical protein [Chryseobacterium sp. SIMBA_038]|uniref:hypothetical protein n=1 Tax=Chryseobacterium sp. SIMBA_038 TaxID=3085780 RepID=UPI003979CD2E
MKTFFSKINDIFSWNNHTPELKHTEDTTEGDEGIDDFSMEEPPVISENNEEIDNFKQKEDSDIIEEN